MELIWLTDIHLNFVEKELRLHFYQEILKTSCDAVLITGDIAEAPSVVDILKEMVSEIKKPVYFVLGNHDYYRGEVEAVKKTMINLTKEERLLYWLPAAGPQILKEGLVLLGEDGWADGRYGDFTNSRVSLNDDRMIMDLFQVKMLGKYHLLEKMQQFADEDAKQLQADLLEVIEKHKPKKIIILTHIPPFKEACLHEEKMSSDDFLPFFASKATGDVLDQVAKENPEINFVVLCGHTHSEALYQSHDNLIVKVGHAEYMKPEIQKTDIVKV